MIIWLECLLDSEIEVCLPAYTRFAIRCSQLTTRGHAIGTTYDTDNQYKPLCDSEVNGAAYSQSAGQVIKSVLLGSWVCPLRMFPN